MTYEEIYKACLAAIRSMGVAEFKKATWFAWRKKRERSGRA